MYSQQQHCRRNGHSNEGLVPLKTWEAHSCFTTILYLEHVLCFAWMNLISSHKDGAMAPTCSIRFNKLFASSTFIGEL